MIDLSLLADQLARQISESQKLTLTRNSSKIRIEYDGNVVQMEIPATTTHRRRDVG